MRREERLDRQSSRGRADAEIATRTARSGQRRTWSRAVVGSLEQGSAETSLLIVCFKAEGG